MTKRLEVALLPSEAEAIEADAFLVIDVLRATTTIATLFEGGLADLLVVDDIEAARERAQSEGRVLFGEVGGLPPEGFDYGNSPAEAAALDVRGQGAVLFTTNGTRAICGSAGRGAVATAAFSNAGAAARWAAAFERVALVCAGNSGGKRFALEDFAAAARLVQLISRESPGLELGDAAGVAAGLTGYEDWIAPGLPQQTDRSARLIAGAHHAQGLKALGLGADIAFAAREDTSAQVPRVAEHGEGWALLRNER
ncbi:MAG: 2-phosphosulfolactate phosphatase [Chloroflexota bacterium]|nr:2-phosphosulfolactate phosphatase [Chloroflexota bacterium]